MVARVLELFWIAGSPFSWSVMLALEAKRIPYTPRLLQASQGEHKMAEFLALNPRGKVPTLREGDFTLYESMAIQQYLEQKYPNRPIFGSSPRETAAIWREISEFNSYLQTPLLRVAVPLLTGKSEQKASEIQAALPEVHKELERLEASLLRTGWLAGPDISAADTTAYPFLKVLQRAAGKTEAGSFSLEPLSSMRLRPRLAAWMQQIERLPGYDRTYPPHWRT
jgi:glutathione S-transferase